MTKEGVQCSRTNKLEKTSLAVELTLMNTKFQKTSPALCSSYQGVTKNTIPRFLRNFLSCIPDIGEINEIHKKIFLEEESDS